MMLFQTHQHQQQEQQQQVPQQQQQQLAGQAAAFFQQLQQTPTLLGNNGGANAFPMMLSQAGAMPPQQFQTIQRQPPTSASATQELQAHLSAASAAAAESKRKGRFLQAQVDAMESLFQINQKPTKEEMMKLGVEQSLEQNQIQQWFSRRRTKEREKNQTAATPSTANLNVRPMQPPPSMMLMPNGNAAGQIPMINGQFLQHGYQSMPMLTPQGLVPHPIMNGFQPLLGSNGMGQPLSQEMMNFIYAPVNGMPQFIPMSMPPMQSNLAAPVQAAPVQPVRPTITTSALPLQTAAKASPVTKVSSPVAKLSAELPLALERDADGSPEPEDLFDITDGAQVKDAATVGKFLKAMRYCTDL
ncbi:hypothetical protein HDU67_005687, partial [Dinochytrium kinnereticum]